MEHCETDAVSATGSFWSNLFSGYPFLPHGHCYLQSSEMVWLHVVSDLLIAVAYYSIPLILFSFVSRRRDVPFNWMFILFGIFILACGTTHLMEIVTVWHPVYRLGGLVKAGTAAVSLLAAVMLIPIIPKALALPSLRIANQQLVEASRELKRSNEELEQFAYIASHDLQEPLRMVSMYMDLIHKRLQDRLDPKDNEYIGYAIEGAQRMRSLIDDLLIFSRIDRDATDQTAAVDADEALDAACRRCASTATSWCSCCRTWSAMRSSSAPPSGHGSTSPRRARTAAGSSPSRTTASGSPPSTTSASSICFNVCIAVTAIRAPASACRSARRSSSAAAAASGSIRSLGSAPLSISRFPTIRRCCRRLRRRCSRDARRTQRIRGER
jgi:hypothetical protein